MHSSRQPTGHDTRKLRTSSSLRYAAEQLFATIDYRDVTVDRIATKAGVSVGSVYVHFGSKEGLYLTVVEDALRLSDQYTANRRWSSSPLERILNTGEAYVDFALEHPGAFRLISTRSNVPGEAPEIQQRISDRMSAELAQLSADIQGAIDAGEIGPLPVRHVLAYIWASWSGVIGMSIRDDDFRISADDARAILAGAGTVLARGIAPTAAQAEAVPGSGLCSSTGAASR